MCPVNANSFQHAYFSVFGTVEMPENTKVNTFFYLPNLFDKKVQKIKDLPPLVGSH